MSIVLQNEERIKKHMPITSQAPVAFSLFTTASGTAEQPLQVSAAGVTAGLTAGNFTLVTPPANEVQGNRFKVYAAGWVKAHGATQTVKLALQWQAYSTTGGLLFSPVDTFTPNASGTLVAGVFYDFLIEQEFYGEPNSGNLYAVPAVNYYIGGQAAITATAIAPATLFCPNLLSASQTEPITGVNNSYNWPAANFYVTITNSVSDTVETIQLTQFAMEQV